MGIRALEGPHSHGFYCRELKVNIPKTISLCAKQIKLPKRRSK